MRTLVAIDDDPVLEDVLGTLRWCVRVSPGDEVVVLHGTRHSWMRRAVESDAASREWVRTEDDAARALLEVARQRLLATGIAAQTVRAEGAPGEEILRAARERQADLLVVGALGWQHRGFLVGSVTHQVEALADCDVLVVRRGAPIGDDPMRAVLAVDGSPDSLAAVRSFAGKMRTTGADVTLVHVVEHPTVSAWEILEPDRPVELERLAAPVRARADAALLPALEALGTHGMKPRVEVWRGRPAEEILAAADRHRAHLVAVGAKGLSGVRGLRVGSVARRLVSHGITSVLVARVPRAPAADAA